MTWKDDALTSVPHTISIFDPTVLPVDFATAYICNWDKRILGVDGPCLQFMDAHGGIPPTTPVVNAGRNGLDVAGDSIFLPPNGSVSAQVTAGPGTTLHYICIIHPWMQGSITVKRTGEGSKDKLKQRNGEAAAIPGTIRAGFAYAASKAVDSEVQGRIGSRTESNSLVFSTSSRFSQVTVLLIWENSDGIA